MADFPGYPVREDILGSTPVQGVHGAHHAALAVAVNALQVALNALGPGLNGDDGREIELNVNATHLRYRYTGDVSYTNLVALSSLVGPAGAEQEFQLGSGNVLQTRTVGDPTWTDVIDFDTLVSPVTAGGGVKIATNKVTLDRVDITWNPDDETTKLGSDIMFTDATADSATTWTRTIINVNPASGTANAANRRLRVTAPTGTTGTNTRIALPIAGSTSMDDEVTSVWEAHSAGAQGGNFHRRNAHPGSGTNFAIVAWHDILFQVDSLLNMNTWQEVANGLTQGSANNSSSNDTPGAQHWLDVRASFKTGTTVTLHVDRGHGITVGGSLSVTTTGIMDNIGTVTAVTTTTITYTSSTTAAADVVGGSGSLMSRLTIFPLTLKSQLVGTTLRVKLWPHLRVPEPGWAAADFAYTWTNTGSHPTSPGPSGIYAGHLATDTAYFDYGRVTWENLDA